MFNFLKKKPTTWIDQPVIDYLMSVSPAYAIYYTVNMGGTDSEESEPDRNINLHINSIGPEARERLLRFLSRLDMLDMEEEDMEEEKW
jgi:hypothetical protein